MDAERARAFLLTLPFVCETRQWGDNLVYRVGDKADGGKMFCLLDLDGGTAHGVAAFAAGPERFAELTESHEDIFPARYLARAKWVGVRRWPALRNAEWEAEFRAAHAVVAAKLPPKAKRAIGLLPAGPARTA